MRGNRNPGSAASPTAFLAPFLAAALAACSPSGAARDADTLPTIEFTLEDQEVPSAFDRRGAGRRIAGGEGLWAVVAGLPRPERAVVRNLRTGAEVTVPLFRGPAGQSLQDIALSPAAAEMIGIGDEPQPVRVTAVRREPRLQSER